jgi:hypothetical protein
MAGANEIVNLPAIALSIRAGRQAVSSCAADRLSLYSWSLAS